MSWFSDLFSSGVDTTSQQTTVPDWAVPAYQNFLQTSQNVANRPYTPYQGQTVAQMNPYEAQALNAQAQRAVYGSPVMDAANAENMRTSAGGYLNDPAAMNSQMYASNQNMGVNPYASGSNPYLSQMVDSASGDVTRNYNNSVIPQLTALDARSGSFGNSGVASATGTAQGELARSLGDISSGLRFSDYNQRAQLNENLANRQFQSGESYANRLFTGGENQAARDQSQYQNERGRMQSAVSQAPGLANQDYIDATALQQAGQGFQRQDQANLTDQFQRFQDAQQYPYKQLQTLGQGVGLNFGQNTTTSTPGTSPMATGVGTAAAMYPLLKSGTNSSPTVICTELHKQGLMSDEIYKLDQAYGALIANQDPAVYAGYIKFATPVVSLMQRSRIAARVVAVIAKPWADEMAHQMGRPKGSVIGKLIMKIGYPLCRLKASSFVWGRS